MTGDLFSNPAAGGLHIPGTSFGAVPSDLVSRWQEVYERYGRLPSPLSAAPGGFIPAARESARVSRELAAVWTMIADCPGHPWWLKAALVSTVQAFDDQAARWERRADESEMAARRSRRPRGMGGPR